MFISQVSPSVSGFLLSQTAKAVHYCAAKPTPEGDMGCLIRFSATEVEAQQHTGGPVYVFCLFWGTGLGDCSSLMKFLCKGFYEKELLCFKKKKKRFINIDCNI
jgi:hypothetical protein